MIFLWAAGSSYGGELHEYVCGEVGNSPILIPTLTRLASRIPNQGKKDVYIVRLEELCCEDCLHFPSGDYEIFARKIQVCLTHE